MPHDLAGRRWGAQVKKPCLMLQRAPRLLLPRRLRKWREQPQFDLSLMLDLSLI